MENYGINYTPRMLEEFDQRKIDAGTHFRCSACNNVFSNSQLHVAHDASDDFDYCEECFAALEDEEDEMIE